MFIVFDRSRTAAFDPVKHALALRDAAEVLDLVELLALVGKVPTDVVNRVEEGHVLILRRLQAVLLSVAHLLRVGPRFAVTFHVLLIAAEVVHLLADDFHFLA